MNEVKLDLPPLPAPVVRLPDNARVSFKVGAEDVLVLEEDGRIFVHGRLAANDLEVVEAFRAWLRHGRLAANDLEVVEAFRAWLRGTGYLK